MNILSRYGQIEHSYTQKTKSLYLEERIFAFGIK